MVSVLERSLLDKKRPRRMRAQAIAAMCVGGMVVARTVVDPVVANELREACTVMANKLGGWEERGGRDMRRSGTGFRKRSSASHKR
jgi:hypothetical protein